MTLRLTIIALLLTTLTAGAWTQQMLMREAYARRGAAVSAWTPASAAGLVWWLDATDASTLTLTSSNTVSQWRDKSGAGLNFNQTNGAVQPVYGSNAVNGLKGIEAVVGHGMLATNMDVLDIIGNYKLAIIFNAKTLIASGSQLSMRQNLSWDIIRSRSTLDLQCANMGGGTARLTVNHFTNAICLVRSGSDVAPQISLRVNGGTYTINVTNATYNAGATKNGFLFGNGTAFSADGLVQEIVAYTNLDSSTELKLEGYLCHKYGIAMPTNHPYYGAAP